MSHTPPVDSKGAENKRYELKKIGDILDIPEESFDNFLMDLKKWAGAGRAARDLVGAVAEAMGEEPPENAVVNVGPWWEPHYIPVILWTSGGTND